MIIKTLYYNPYMTNSYIVADSEGNCVIIDPACDIGIISGEIIKNGLTPLAILLTHGHFDHILGIPEILEKYGDLPVYIHKDEEQFLYDANLNLSATLFGASFTCYPQVKTVTDNEIISIGNMTFKVIHTPGHTRGCVCYVIENSIFSGDTLFASTIGRTDFPGGSYPTLIDSLKKLKALEGDYDVYPGHNASTTLNREKMYNEYMQ